MQNSILIFYHKTRMKRLINKYEKTHDASLNEEFQRTCHLLQQIDPTAPKSKPPHISEMVELIIIDF